MFVFVVWQINCPSLWFRSSTSVRCLTMKATIRRLKYVRSPRSEVWKLVSKVHNRKSDVRSLTENCLNDVQTLKYYVCLFKTWSPKTKVLSPKYVQSPKSESETKVWSLSVVYVWNRSPESNAQNSKFEVKSLKSEVGSLSEVRSKFFAIMITLSSYNTGIIYYVFVDQINDDSRPIVPISLQIPIIISGLVKFLFLRFLIEVYYITILSEDHILSKYINKWNNISEWDYI